MRELLRLDEPYRTVILLRFYEGLSSAEISRREGIPAGTIRWRLKQGLKELSDIHILDPRNRDAKSSHYCLSVVWGDKLQGQRNELAVHLNEAGIGTSIYYPQPVPRMSYYRNKYGYDAGAFHRAAQISDQSVALPVGPHVTADDIKYIADKLSSALMEVKI